MGDAIEQLLLEKQLEEFAEAGLVVPSLSAEDMPLDQTLDELVVAGILGDITSPIRGAVKGLSKAAGGIGNIAAGVLGGPGSLFAAALKKGGAPDVVTTALNPMGSIIRKGVGGASAGFQSPGNILERFGGGVQGGAAGVFKGQKDVVRNPLIKAVSTGLAFVFPPLAAVPVAMTAADKLITQVESVDPIKKALAVKAVQTTGQAAKAGDRDAQRGLALLGLVKSVRNAASPKKPLPNGRHSGYFVSAVGKILKGTFIADTSGMPGIVAVGGGNTVIGNWRRA